MWHGDPLGKADVVFDIHWRLSYKDTIEHERRQGDHIQDTQTKEVQYVC